MKSLLIALIPLVAALAGGDEPSRFKLGEVVRLTGLTPEGAPAPVEIFASPEDAAAGLRRFDEAAQAHRPMPLEDRASAGHNTRAMVHSAATITPTDTPMAIVQVRFLDGPLKDHHFWVTARRLRPDREPDPAIHTGPSIRPWDPELRPEVGLRVMLLGFREKGGPQSSALFPGERTLELAIADSELRTDGSDLNVLWVAPGTKAVIWQVPKGGKVVRVKVTSGPFAGQIHWARPEHLCRLEIYDREVFGRKGALP
jgi:hypothetical protein